MSTQATETTDPTVVTPPAAEDKPVKTFTQDEVTAIATREKDEGKRSAEAAVAKELGVSVAEAKKILKDHAAAEDAKKSDADKAREAAEAEKTAAAAEKSAAATEIFETRLERAFLKEGLELDDEKIKRVRRMVGVEAGASYEDILKDVQAVKAEFPSLFDGTGAGTPKAPNGDPGGRPPKPVKGEDKFAAGAARAAARYAKP